MDSNYRKTRKTHSRGTRILQPLANDVLEGTLYFVTDEGVIERSNGSAWESFSGTGSGSISNASSPILIPIIDGEDGIDGFPGLRGSDGIAGAAGVAGTQGLRGIPGMDGLDGEDSGLIVLSSSLGGLISQGIWTPNDSSGAGLTFTLTTQATWIKIGSLVILSFDIVYPTTVNTANSRIGGIPFALIGSNNGFGGFMTSTNYNASVNEITFFGNTTTFDFRDTGGAAITNVALSGKVVRGTVIYQTAQ